VTTGYPPLRHFQRRRSEMSITIVPKRDSAAGYPSPRRPPVPQYAMR
jgi:hypothetical protein